VNDQERRRLGFGPPITRRDFLNGTLLDPSGLLADGTAASRTGAATDT
jgi:hypothetical protein